MITYTSNLPKDLNLLTTFEEQHPKELRWELEYKLDRHADNLSCCFIYQLLDDIVVGELILEFFDPNEVCVSSYTILPEYRNRALGKALIQEGIRQCKAAGFKRLIGAARQGASLKTAIGFNAELKGVNNDWGGSGEDYQSISIKL